MLAMSNKLGYVSASIGGLAHEARVTREECEKALNVLKSPDNDSRSKEFDGRRIEIVDGGFQLLNHQKYRAMRSEEERKEYMKSYMRDYRARTKNVNKNVKNVSECKPPLAQADADADADTDTDIIHTESVKLTEKVSLEGFERFWTSYPKKVARAVALRSWLKLNGKVDIEKILKAVEIQSQHPNWQKDEGKYIPHPATWLNQERWNDAVSTKKKTDYSDWLKP